MVFVIFSKMLYNNQIRGGVKMVIFITILVVIVGLIIWGIIAGAAKTKRQAKMLEEAAGKGNSKADFDWGAKCLEDGRLPEAKQWLGKALEQGYSEAESKLKICALMEQGLSMKDAQKKVAAEQFELGRQYFNGEGVPKDLEKAVYWYTKAAELGDGSAQWVLGEMYFFGNEIPKDLKKAVYWNTKAAKQGNPFAQLALGECYSDGIGVSKNMREAFTWYLKAAEQGLAVAQNNIGSCYHNGEGVTKDLQQARYWYTKAARQGVEMAQRNLNKLDY